MQRSVFILLFLIIATTSRSQFLDSLNVVFHSKSSIDARFESRYSFIENGLASITGVRLGVAFSRKLRIGGGISWLKSNVPKTFYQINDLGNTETTIKYLKFGYLCYYIDFVYYKTQRWQLSVPIQAGAGLAWYQKEENYRLNSKDKKYFFLLYEPGITVQFKIFRYFGLGSDVAYRFVFKDPKKISERLLSPTLSFKILFWPDQLFFELKPNHKLTKRFGPAEW
jgi:hypothetical protein